jgi:drug/metabolite transporter (DMT)-like permease
MRAAHVALVVLFAVGMGTCQLLLKYAAHRQASKAGRDAGTLIGLLLDWPFLAGAASYALLLIFWMWLLTFLPLSRAYPFTLLSLVVATVGGAILFHEPLTPRFLTGLFVISMGLLMLGTE